MSMSRNVKGILFVDYVRMIRSNKDVDWSQYLLPEDLEFLKTRVVANQWYPMATFERMGNAILAVMAGGDVEAVRLWGRLSVDPLRSETPTLVVTGDPLASLTRFKQLRGTFFDFEALRLPVLEAEHAEVVIAYHMGMPAEEAAANQTMGFFERVLELSGCEEVRVRFRSRSWDGDAATVLELAWKPPS